MCDVCQIRVLNEPDADLSEPFSLMSFLMDYSKKYGKHALIHLVSCEFCICTLYTELELSTVRDFDIAYHTAFHAFDLGENSLDDPSPKSLSVSYDY